MEMSKVGGTAISRELQRPIIQICFYSLSRGISQWVPVSGYRILCQPGFNRGGTARFFTIGFYKKNSMTP